MAFLCPVRIRNTKTKKKKVEEPEIIPGRITGSSSVETLVRVGLEKANASSSVVVSELSRMLVLHDFTPCVDDELEVRRGEIVSLLYRENDWAYVIQDETDKEGFIPFSYLQIQQNNNQAQHFSKDSDGEQYVVLYTFIARDENDVSVERGEMVTVLNKEDPDWFWVMRSVDGQEGFVPSAFVFPLNFIKDTKKNAEETSGISEQQQQGTELVMLYDYKAQAVDDLQVRRGDWVYADLHHQTVEGWLWAFAPKQKKYGFIPKAYARPPAMTSL